ncbi:MAG: hypothetical protein ABI685_11360, partial [Ferruginibacter sp.]
MDFNKILKVFTGVTVTIFCMLFFIGCNEKVKNAVDNTFYLEFVNFTKDSLKQEIASKILGKVAFYKNDEMKILSVNYITDDLTNLHYFKPVEELGNDITENTKKIRLEFKGDYTADSISYSLQKFTYSNKQWKKTSDMGVLKSTNTWSRAKEFAIPQ